MRRTIVLCFACLTVLLLIVLPLSMAVAAAEPNAPIQPKLMISELQTGGVTLTGTEEGKQEFIELYNPADTHLDVTDWRVEYLAGSHTGAPTPTRLIAVLEGEVPANGYVLLGYEGLVSGADLYFGAGSTAASGLLAKGGGHVRIVDSTGSTVDLVGWGTGVAIGSWWRAPEIPANSSIQRFLPGEDGYTDGTSYRPPSPDKTPLGGGLHLPVPTPEAACKGLAITELLPNPEGADSGKEFIELHNPTDQPLAMKGCSLRLGDTGKTFPLPDEIMPAKTYRSFSDSQTGIVLPNAIAQTVWLLWSDEEHGTFYADGLSEGEAWAYAGTAWLPTLTPTPGAANSIFSKTDMPEEVQPDPAIISCPSGKERNPATNRCRNIEAPKTPEPCSPGYARSAETGRCRKLAVPAPLSPCKAGQQRSPDTNRCRSVLAASDEPKPCAAGQERNQETNRCRKISAANGTMASVEDVRTGASGIDARWWIAAALVVGATGYAVYEWRQDIGHATRRLKQRVRQRIRPKGKGS